jgi:hypothetical protein
MIIRNPKKPKDLRTTHPHREWSRRDFIKRGLATSTAAVLMPESLLGPWVKDANALTTCPPQVRQMGALAQVFREGGPSIGAAFLNATQAAGMTATAASNYGIAAASDIVQAGSNWYVSRTSPFGIAVLTPPPGYSATQWTAVLKQTSLGGHWGPFAADDGAGVNLGHLGAASAFKSSMLGKDLRIRNGAAKAIWAEGIPSASASSISVSSIASKFGITPTTGITPQVLTASATAADSLGTLFANAFGLSGRKRGMETLTKAICGFYSDSVLATPGLGVSLFDPTRITALATATIQPSLLTPAQQALFSSFYQSAIGSLGAVVIQQNGGDYHNDFDLAYFTANVAPNDFEAGTYVQMFIAACDAARAPGAMITVANGNCACDGAVDTTINTSLAVKVPVTTGGDQGGFLNAGTILCFSPTTPPVLRSTGTFNMADGRVTAASNVFGVPTGVAGLYLTAFSYLGLDVARATAAMQGAGINNPQGLMLI